MHLAVEVIFPTWLLLGCLDRLNRESPHTRIELIESVLGHRTAALARGQADLAIFGSIPAGFLGEALMRLRFVLAAHPDHPLHKLRCKLSMRDLRGGERYSELYLIFADREHAGPATLRLAAIIREAVESECQRYAAPSRASRRRSAQRRSTS